MHSAGPDEIESGRKSGTGQSGRRGDDGATMGGPPGTTVEPTVSGRSYLCPVPERRRGRREWTTDGNDPGPRMSYGDQHIEAFLDDVASRRVTPAGGTAAAIVGATGTALCEMACIHTIESDEDADVAGELAEVRDELERQREALLDLADRDTAAVDELLAASGDEATRRAEKTAIGVPLSIAEACLNVLECATVVTEKGNRNVVADAVAGVLIAHSALRSCVYIVRTNLERMADDDFVAETERRAVDVERSAERAVEQVMATDRSDQ